MTDHKFHIVSIEDREMFAYNAAYQRRQAEQAKITPEQRIKGYIADGDSEMVAKCYNGIAKYSEVLDYSEAHF